MKKTCLAAFVLLGATAYGLNWDNALIMGTTPGGKMFYEPGEEMVFTLKLEGMKEPLPTGTYFVDWERRGDDGLKERGRAPLPFPPEGLVLKTKSDKPGFVCIEANVVTKDGKRVPKNHRWEKRVFFQGGAGVQPELIPMADEPADYDAFWDACLKELAAVPMDAQMTPVECPDKEVRLYAVRIPCAGPWPVTGYLTIPVKASKTNRMPITASYRGASQDEQLPPKNGPHDRISMLINPNGYELGRGPEYVKQFFKDVSEPGFGYGMGPKSNEKKETSYWKWCALRAIRYLQWIKTLPEWNGKELVLGGGSQGDWQCYHAAAHVPGVTRINANGSWGCDWTGQEQFKRLRSTYRPGCWYPDMAYFDPVFAAKRISCPVNISFSGLGDYCSTPASLTLVYRNLKGPKKITYVQGSTHGWRPAGTQRFTVDGGFDAATQPPPAEKVSAFDPLDAVRAALARGEKKVVLPKRLYLVKPKDNGFYLRLKGVSDTVIDFSGSELRGLANTGFFHLEDCTNVTIRNVELDYRDLPFTQARIVSADKDGTQTLETIDGYPRPSGNNVGGWPFQVYDKNSLELKNPMRMGAGFKLERLADGRYRVSGGGNRAGAVGDIAVWSMPAPKGTMEGDHVSVRDVVHSRATVRCVFENITEYATPGGRAFEEHLTEANVYRNCRIVRRPPETDFAKRGLKRLRSGNHDAFMSRRAVVGPKILGCTALYHCDDAVNISGMYGVVCEVKGNEVRLLEYTPTVFHAGDTAQAMSADGRTLPQMAVKVIGAREAMTAEERAYMTTIGLWRGLDKLCRTAIRVTVDDASALKRGDAVISDRAQGNGFEIRGCHFGHNRAFCVRIRASNGTIADNVFDRPESCGIYLGPEYEWLEGGLSENVTISNNVFIGCKPHIGGTAAHRKHIPREAYRNVSVQVPTGETPVVPVARLDPIGHIRAEIAAGRTAITIPKARYWLTPPAGATSYLELTGLSGVTIDFAGSELVGTVKTTMLALHACTNVTVRNVSVDYADLPFTQAVIEKVDKDGGWDVRVIPGYPCPAPHALSADDIWPVQAYDAKTLELKNPMRFRDNIAIARTGTDTYRITGGQNRKGDVGDIAVWSIRETMRPSRRGAVTAGTCAGCTFENVTVYATPHGCGFAESSADGNRYLGCSLVRRPPETDLFPRALKRLRSGNHDAFNSRCSYVGPTLDRCTFQYHCDDCVNISGFYAFVTEQKGRTLRIAPYGGTLRIDPGDTCQLMTFKGICLPDAQIVSVKPAGATTAAERKMFESYNLWPGIAAGVQRAFEVELDADRVLPPGSVIISNRRMGNGFRIRNCTMGHNRARGLLIKASDGVIESNLIERVEGWAVQIAPEYEWMEGGCSKNMTVKGNLFRDNGGGVLVAGNNGARKPLPADSHRNVAITGNAISGSVRGIAVTGCTRLDVRGNAINLPAHPKARAIDLVNVADVQE